jgi:hypothetical protein
MNSIPKSFCAAPFSHTYISPQGERRMCCASRETSQWDGGTQYIDSGTSKNTEFSPSTLQEWWNSEYMKSIRVAMLNGETLSQCEVCNNNVLNLHTYKQYFNETLFPHKLNELIERTNLDGYLEDLPTSYDYRVSNLCNFKCRMCGPELSSSWESEKRILGTWNPQNQKWMVPNNKVKIEKFQTEVVEQELWNAVNDDSIEEIYWVGGEPLMYQIHWDIMKKLVETGQSKKIVVRYNTNLSQVSYKGISLYEDVLPHFKRVNICASQDSFGSIATYIRTGCNWDIWLDNFKKGIFLNSLYGMNGMVIDVTLTLPGLFGMKELMKLATELNVKSYVKITFDFDPKVLMSPMCLPHCILDPVLDELIEYESTLNNPLTKVYSDTFKDMKNRQTFDQKYSDYDEGLKLGKQHLLSLEQHRKHPLTMDTILTGDVLTWWKNV